MNAHSVVNASLAGQWQAAQRDASPWYSVESPCAERPRDLVARAAALRRPYFFWQSADRRRSLLGVGELLRLRAAGADRLQAVAEAARNLAAPLLLGTFAFSDKGPLAPPFRAFAPADFIVPQLIFEERDDVATVRLIGRHACEGKYDALSLLQSFDRAAPERWRPVRVRFVDRPGSRDVWRDEVLRARSAIRSGSLEKVVLARTSLALATSPIDAARVVQALLLREQDCNVFAVHRGDATFLGATPERLVQVEDHVAQVPCLAGSAPRGATPAEDLAIGQALLGSPKNRREHHFVVEAVEAALRGQGLTPELAAAPQLRRLRSVQHLFTPVRARLGSRDTIFTLAAALHPTPALGGTPRSGAQAWISEHERSPRGLFGGGVGYWRQDGEGEFDVAIRCGLVSGSLATLWAGCGIVGDSDPEEELRETELKLRPMRQALREASSQ